MSLIHKAKKTGIGAADRLLKKAVSVPLSPQKLQQILDEASRRQPAAVLNELKVFDFVRAERALFGHCEDVQRLVLQDIIRTSRDTEFGRKHGFEAVRSPEDFRSAVPVTTFEDYESDIERMERGEENILFPGKAVFFYRTSGTTSDYKSIPESAAEVQARKALTQARYLEMIVSTSLRVLTHIFAFFNRPSYDTTEGGIPSGAASGRTVQMTNSFLLNRFAYTPRLVECLEGEALEYTIMRIAIAHPDVSTVLGNNAQIMSAYVRYAAAHAEEIIEDIRRGTCRYPLPDDIKAAEAKALAPSPRRADQLKKLLDEGIFIPRYYWPDFLMASFWLEGSVGVFADDARALFPESTVFMDVGYGASEAKINIPNKPGKPAGPLSIFTGFFEFLPEDGETPVLAHELEDGKTYEILLTTYAGLYRYRIGDYIRVDGFTGTTPNICFLSKAGDVANLTQEKIPGALLAAAVREITQKEGLGFVGCQVFPDREALRYVICLETEKAPADTDSFRIRMDDGLTRRIAHYDMYRNRHTVLRACEVRFMKAGWFESLTQARAKGSVSTTQVKVPVIIDRLPSEAFLRQ